MAPLGPSGRRQAELRHARDSLRAEWSYWIAQAARPATDLHRPTFEKHETQINSLVRMMLASLDALGEYSPSETFERVLDLHHVWDFFRVKLALRYVEPIREFLGVADELAWAAYRSAMRASEASGGALREPPLVFLDRGAVPFANARGSSYRDLLPRDVRTRAGVDAASVLPFPVIGVPWYLSGHLPGVLLVAHEVGHHIEDDCALTSSLLGRLAATRIGTPRQEVWRPWLGEVFADVVASLTCGVAYPTVLLDALTAAPVGGAGMESYPPSRVRVRVCMATINSVGLPMDPKLVTEGDRLGEPSYADQEASEIVTAILTKPYGVLGGQTLPAVLVSPAIADAGEAAERLLAGASSNVTDVRAVLAAAALAFSRDSEEYDQRHVGKRATKEVHQLRPAGPRLGGDATAREARDVAAGLSLLSRLNA